MLYLFFTGTTPFNTKKESLLLENIKNVNYSFDNTDIPDDAKDLISKILIKDPQKSLILLLILLLYDEKSDLMLILALFYIML